MTPYVYTILTFRTIGSLWSTEETRRNHHQHCPIHDKQSGIIHHKHTTDGTTVAAKIATRVAATAVVGAVTISVNNSLGKFTILLQFIFATIATVDVDCELLVIVVDS